jgi:hypothetical protein
LGVALAMLTQLTGYAVWASTLLVIYALAIMIAYLLALVGLGAIHNGLYDLSNVAAEKIFSWRTYLLSIFNLTLLVYVVIVLINTGTFGSIIGGLFIGTLAIFYVAFISYHLLVYRHHRRKEENMVE